MQSCWWERDGYGNLSSCMQYVPHEGFRVPSINCL